MAAAERSKEIFIKVMLVAERLAVVIAVLVFIAVIAVGYRFILVPQYQRLLAAREEERFQALEHERAILTSYTRQLRTFIDKAETLTSEDRARIASFFYERPEDIVLFLQFQKFLSEFSIEVVDIRLGAPQAIESIAEGEPEELDESRPIDLGSILRGDVFLGGEGELGATQASAGEVPPPRVVEERISISFSSEDYFTVKDVLATLEGTLPLLDVTSLSLSFGEGGDVSASLDLVMRYLEEARAL